MSNNLFTNVNKNLRGKQCLQKQPLTYLLTYFFVNKTKQNKTANTFAFWGCQK